MAKKSDDTPKIPKRVRIVLAKLSLGEVLCTGLKRSDVGDERYYWFEPSGKTAPPKSSEQAIAQGLLIPAGDGLFGDSQTYRLASV